MSQPRYFLPSELNSITSSFSPNSVKAIHLNARSVRNKLLCLEEFFSEFLFQFSVIMLSETWSTCEYDVLKLANYKTYYLNRTKCRGGGVALLLCNSYECEVLELYSMITPDYEILSLCAGTIVFSVCYRPPNGNVTSFLEIYDRFLSFVCENEYTLVAGGDFNINMNDGNQYSRQFNTVILSGGFINVINVPTRVTAESESTLDIFITNSVPFKMEAGVMSCLISDHLPVFLFLENAGPLPRKQECITYQRITDSTLHTFRDALLQTNWDDVRSTKNANEAYNQFLRIFKTLYSLHFPTQVHRPARKTRKPWITAELLQRIKTKDKLYKAFLNTRSLEDLRVFKQYRNQLTKQLRSARTKYYTAFLDIKHGRRDVLWTRINSLLHRYPSHTPIRNLKVNGEEQSGRELANAFNNFFTTMPTSGSADEACKYIHTVSEKSMFLQPVTEQEVISIIQNFKNSSSCDIDGLQVRPVKHVADIIAPILADIFNICLTEAVFPRKMQVAKISVIYKKGDRNDLGNYRPISILPIFSKAFEKILYSRISKFADKHCLISQNQFGFRKNMSTELALLEQKEYILTQLENKDIVLGIFIDFSKAFDLVNHEVLLKKLWYYGIRGHEAGILHSYLSYRKQIVYLNNEHSEIKSVTSGVPQGSKLGPLLFIIYLNDIININPIAKFIIYADDTSMFFSGSDIKELVGECNHTLIELQKWSTANSMKVNVNKSKAVVFRSKNKPVPPHPSIMLNSNRIEIVDNFKCLGVVFSATMSWESHVNSLATKLAQLTGIIGRLRYILTSSVKLMLYNSLFYSHLNYCQLVWGTATYSCLQRIHVLQKKCLRHIYNAPYGAPSSNFFSEAGVIRIHSLYRYRLSVRFKLDIRRNIDFMRTLAQLRERDSSYSVRHREPWAVPVPRLNTGKERLQYTLPCLLNGYHHIKFDLFTCSHRELRAMYQPSV